MQAENRTKTAAGISQVDILINSKVTGSRFNKNQSAGARGLVPDTRGDKASTQLNPKFISDRDGSAVRAADY